MPSMGGWEWLIVVVVPMVLFVSAMVSIARRQAATGTEKAIWILISLIFPFVGPILWFAIGKKAAHGASTTV